MAWQTPKTDWATDDAIGTADLNRIEGNILELNRTHVSGFVVGDLAIAGLDVPCIAAIRIDVPAGYSIKLKRVRFSIDSTGDNMRLIVQGHDGTGASALEWQSSSEGGDEEPDEYVFSNYSGVSVLAGLTISVLNTNVSAKTLVGGSGGAIEVAIESGVAPTTTTTTAGA